MTTEPKTVIEFRAEDLLAELDVGIFQRKLSSALATTALSTSAQDGKRKKGRVTVIFDLEKVSEGGTQLCITHKLVFSRPTGRGKASEEDTTETVVHVGPGGAMSVLPFNQPALPGMERRTA